MRRAVVGCENTSACGLYASIGFRRSWTLTAYSR
jgi:ribosomal protein S18 acetylase RimI-like enzyme